ncbi:cytochrome P450 [Saccharopolyspora sp. NFXS83]|uniref:cytochrome P450 n=1 Tax=Saccharopolyspora sp. NFXS83 TaxID=2993560 RepID=UPI00224B9C90|nr:cytochrome P450 [Saccharopolyspora sp. NFXS83]MCX2731030.1 cytochrome P450 [Saccharopolyspora sp. NFXS83]
MPEVTDEPVREFPVARRCPYAPPEEYAQLRESAPVSQVRTPTGSAAWVLTRHEDVRFALSDPRFSADRRNPAFPFLAAGQQESISAFRPNMLSMDEPEHGPVRRSVLGEFTVRRMREMRPRIQRIVDDCLDSMLAGPKPADLVAELALPVPSLVICELLGVPYADHDFFQECSSAMLRRTTPAEERVRAAAEVRSFLRDLITAKKSAPGDDLLSRQLAKQREEGIEDDEDLVATATLLLVAGHETTANMISLGTLTLLENPDDIAAIRQDPRRTLGMVEELLRYLTIVETVTSRVATADVEVGGTLIREGEAVIALGHTANHDPATFPEPSEFDIDRGARQHVAFGYGPHQCLGQNLARMELQIVFDSLFGRIPSLALAGPRDELPFKDDAVIYGVYSMPVTW